MVQPLWETRSQSTTNGEVAVELAVNVDDVTGEVLADAIEQLLAAGAFDAWITPIIMKKDVHIYRSGVV